MSSRTLLTLRSDDAGARALISEHQWDAIARGLELSRRECDIVKCFFDGCKESQAAERLGISTHTVHTHVERLYRKLDVHDRCQLLVRVIAAFLTVRNRITAPA